MPTGIQHVSGSIVVPGKLCSGGSGSDQQHFRRADQIQWASGIEPNDPRYVDYFLPIVADAEAGFGGVLNAFELMKSMIEAGAAAVHFEDRWRR